MLNLTANSVSWQLCNAVDFRSLRDSQSQLKTKGRGKTETSCLLAGWSFLPNLLSCARNCPYIKSQCHAFTPWTTREHKAFCALGLLSTLEACACPHFPPTLSYPCICMLFSVVSLVSSDHRVSNFTDPNHYRLQPVANDAKQAAIVTLTFGSMKQPETNDDGLHTGVDGMQFPPHTSWYSDRHGCRSSQQWFACKTKVICFPEFGFSRAFNWCNLTKSLSMQYKTSFLAPASVLGNTSRV